MKYTAAVTIIALLANFSPARGKKSGGKTQVVPVIQGKKSGGKTQVVQVIQNVRSPLVQYVQRPVTPLVKAPSPILFKKPPLQRYIVVKQVVKPVVKHVVKPVVKPVVKQVVKQVKPNLITTRTSKKVSPTAAPTRNSVKPTPTNSCAVCGEKEDCVTNYKGDFIRCLITTRTTKKVSPTAEPTRNSVEPTPTNSDPKQSNAVAPTVTYQSLSAEPTSDAYLETTSVEPTSDEASETAHTTSTPTVQASAAPYTDHYVEPYAYMSNSNIAPTLKVSEEGAVYSGGLKLTLSALSWLATLLTIF